MPEQSRTALIIVVAVVVLVLLSVLWMPLMMGPWMMGGWGGPWGGSASPWWGVFGLGFGVLIIAGIGLLAVWGVRQLGSEGGSRGSSALDILKQRYARGELTRDQYEQMRHDLE